MDPVIQNLGLSPFQQQPVAVLELTTENYISQQPALNFEYLIPLFIDHATYDLSLAKQTIYKYKEALYWIAKMLPEVQNPSDLRLEHVTKIKKQTLARISRATGRGCGPSRVNSFVYSLRKFLTYCRDVHKLPTLDPKEIKPMKIPKRQVVFLTKDEVRQLLGSIDVNTKYGLRARTLMEVLLDTGGRISETLNLNRDSINLQTKEATIIVKGNKELVVFFNDRALEWINKYLQSRTDDNPALFVTFGKAKRLARYDLGKEFRRYASKAGIKKKVTPHTLRHTAATIMLENGCDIRYIQELLGHSDIRTTAQYYLGTDKRALKAAHTKFMNYDN